MKSKTLIKSGWEVEWCANLPRNEFGDADIDNADFRTRDFSEQAKALDFAREMLSKDAFGSVRVTPFEMEEYEPGCGAYHKVFTADSEHIED